MSDEDRIDDELEALHRRAGNHLEEGEYQTSFRLFGELRNRSRSESRVIPYIYATFHQMDESQCLLDYSLMRERAIELIPLLQDEERARVIQPDLPEQHYSETTFWMLACVYEQLAEATGMLDGYNSPGMHECINEGLHICRVTGKLRCINCFREYATDVYLAADDLVMARYQCQLVMDYEGSWSDRGDRRWLVCKKAAWIAVLEGDLTQAEWLLNKSKEHCQPEGLPLKQESMLRAALDIEALCLLSGQPVTDQIADLIAARPPVEEWTSINWLADLNIALRAALAGDTQTAIERLTYWDQFLASRKILTNWFETRLRLIAVTRLSGNAKRVERLGADLEQKAEGASDWLTLRRLRRLLDESQPLSLVAALAELRETNWEPNRAAPEESAEFITPQDDEELPDTPLKAELDQLHERFSNAAMQQDAALLPSLDELLAYGPDRVSHWHDAGTLVHLATYLINEENAELAVWRWGQSLYKPYQQEGTLLNVLATLGDVLVMSQPELAEHIPIEQIAEMYKQSLRLTPSRAKNFMRAGKFFMGQRDAGEAERMFARGFRLDRSNGELAICLAEVYRLTDRPRDALQAVDLCLRAGTRDAPLLWKAILLADEVEQYDSLVTYLDLYEEVIPDQPWTGYFRAVALNARNRPEEALAALNDEQAAAVGGIQHIQIIRAESCVLAGKLEESREAMQQVLATRFGEVDYLPAEQFTRDCQRLWYRLNEHQSEEPHTAAWGLRLLQAGIVPDDYFQPSRNGGEEQEVRLFRCIVRQDLADNWSESASCRPHEAEWSEYLCPWGVLAVDEDQARELVLAIQAECYGEGTAEVLDVAPEGEYTDRPGIVWQGIRGVRRSAEPDEEQN